MKLKYIGGKRRDGSYPLVRVGSKDVRIDNDGCIEVGEDDAEALLDTDNFEVGESQSQLQMPTTRVKAKRKVNRKTVVAPSE